MAQQIINIPINWDDDALTKAIEKGVISEVKAHIEKKVVSKLGIDSSWGWTAPFSEIVREEIRKTISDNRDEIVNEIIKRATTSLTKSKAYNETVANAIAQKILKDSGGDEE